MSPEQQEPATEAVADEEVEDLEAGDAADDAKGGFKSGVGIGSSKPNELT